MTNANKAKGSRWELDVVRFLAETFGRHARRPHAEGFLDVGDVHLPPFVLQAKDCAKHELGSWIADAELQASRAGEPFGVAVVKRRGAPTALGYVVLSLHTFRRVAARLQAAEERLLLLDPGFFTATTEETRS